MPLIRRLPKFGFSNEPHRIKFEVIRVAVIDLKFSDGEEVSLKTLAGKKLISSKVKNVKIVGGGTSAKKIKFSDEIKSTQSVKKLFGIAAVAPRPKREKFVKKNKNIASLKKEKTNSTEN